MKHLASPEYWDALQSLPLPIQELAKKNFDLLKENPRHPSLYFKRVGPYRSVRVGLHYRAIGINVEDGVLWIWMGHHADYDKMMPWVGLGQIRGWGVCRGHLFP